MAVKKSSTKRPVIHRNPADVARLRRWPVEAFDHTPALDAVAALHWDEQGMWLIVNRHGTTGTVQHRFLLLQR
jgi:hypothetical protein